MQIQKKRYIVNNGQDTNNVTEWFEQNKGWHAIIPDKNEVHDCCQ